MIRRPLIAFACVPLLGVMLAAATLQQPAVKTIKTSKGSFALPGKAYTDGRDLEAQPPLTVTNINVWDAVPRTRAVCRVPHAAQVELLEARMYTPEERYYFRVRAGKCEGWLPEVFLSQKPMRAVGQM